MNAHIFTKPQIEIVTLELDDIIVTSYGIELPDDEWIFEE